MHLLLTLLTITTSVVYPLPADKRGFWSDLKHEVENAAHQVGHNVEGAAVTDLTNAAVGALGKREISADKRGFWSDLKHEVENAAHQVGHNVEGAAVTDLTNAAVGALGKREISADKRGFWSDLKHEVENAAHQVGHNVEGGGSDGFDKRCSRGTGQERNLR
ncbi:uncharacterized protein LOC124277455 [Haliotis rubra]|uniref:uncharacterized protein LOC124277455 n=1 Tax=Haliotis rubra TaxID=36100 RepID=UPI001EE58E23|nr:uncharacterized protein LOC124277455 [Haliotis rubra]